MMSPTEALVIATFVQALLYGIYVTTLGHCLRWLLYEDEGWQIRKRINWFMFVVTALLFVFSTTDLGITLETTLSVLTRRHRLLVGRLDIVNASLEFSTMLIIDAILIYRCWVVYAYSWTVIVLPLIWWIAAVAFALAIICMKAIILVHVGKWPDALFSALWIVLFSCNIATNVYATGAIIYRVLTVTKGGTGSARRLHNTIGIIAESGLLYTISSILNLAGSSLNSTYVLLKILLDAINFSMAGITFNLILIRVRQQRASNEDTYYQTTKKPRLSTLQFRITKPATESSPTSDEEQGHQTTVGVAA